ncbi:unnamed protein product [Rodentolepis nana]|uniref:Secreted protein n=1 Tax=Rodentolepis nana TaxID=102285 RepID=A0A0R3TDT9_RODNA|nr:unnamed protein product [Rodentolepis nana]
MYRCLSSIYNEAKCAAMRVILKEVGHVIAVCVPGLGGAAVQLCVQGPYPGLGGAANSVCSDRTNSGQSLEPRDKPCGTRHRMPARQDWEMPGLGGAAVQLCVQFARIGRCAV